MDTPANPSAGIDHINKELERLHGQLALVNSGPFQDAQVVTGLCTQISAYQAMLSTFISAKQAEQVVKLVEHSGKLTAQTDMLIELTKSAESLTRRLVKLTWALIIVSVALLIFAIWQTEVLITDSGQRIDSKNTSTNQAGANTNGK